ncbi:UNVERIFIED_CONTAM: hypothetical protein Slati_3757700 [Sesamum latifolium]|uniref:Uncharacterized protein n=1 Tax=Sesamum latifolium TaxID=2727402 RepID=A0AAW2U3X1_9LAMI
MADELPVNCRTPAIAKYDGTADPMAALIAESSLLLLPGPHRNGSINYPGHDKMLSRSFVPFSCTSSPVAGSTERPN